MRGSITAFAIVLFSWVQAQQFRKILVNDPLLTNGYIVVDQNKRTQLGITRVEVDLMAKRRQPNGTYQTTTAQSLVITTGFWAKADLKALDLQDGDDAFYRLRAFNNAGGIVLSLDGAQTGQGPGRPWPQVCRETCNSNTYAWALRGFADQGSAYIDMVEATSNGAYFYFYVKAADWQQFKLQFTPSDFGLGLQWTQYTPQSGQMDVRFLDDTPPGAKNYLGYAIPGSSGPVVGIRKDRGPWRTLYATADLIQNSLESLCASAPGAAGALRNAYNTDEDVTPQLALNSLPPVTCAASTTYLGGQLNWGQPGPLNPCQQITMWGPPIIDIDPYDPEGPPSLLSWVNAVIGCYGQVAQLSSVSSVVVNRWEATNKTPVLTVKIPNQNDKKLIYVPRTTLNPGLYEFLIVRNDGTILSHFEHTDEPRTISANFADFTEVNVYPVPVTGTTFSVDIDLIAPMAVNLRIINNMGIPYYTKALNFTVAGRNKHVVTMASDWPNGIYHAQFQYPDGSMESMAISVQ